MSEILVHRDAVDYIKGTLHKIVELERKYSQAELELAAEIAEKEFKEEHPELAPELDKAFQSY